MILVVEDNIHYNNLICSELSNVNNDVLGFTSVEQSLMENSDNPDIIILNYNLNKTLPAAIDGEKGIKIYKSLYPESKIIVFSGQNSLEKALHLVNVGADEYIFKSKNSTNKINPYSINMLVDKVKKYVN
jgi:two-component system response regulator AtoC